MATTTDDSVINHHRLYFHISILCLVSQTTYFHRFIQFRFVLFFFLLPSSSLPLSHFPITLPLKIDFSKFNFPREIWFSKSSAEIVRKLLLLLPIILCGVIGNLLLLNIIIRNRALHSSQNYILANMIAADTLTIMFCPVVFICSDFFQNFILGSIGCKGDGFLQGCLFCFVPAQFLLSHRFFFMCTYIAWCLFHFESVLIRSFE